MAFETEPLLMRSVQWLDRAAGPVLRVDKNTFIEPALENDEQVSPPEFTEALHDFLETYHQANMLASFQQVVLALRRRPHPPKLQAIHKALEFLCDHEILQNPSAHRFVDLLRNDFPWRHSISLEPFLTLTIFKWPAGVAWRGVATALTFICLAAGLIGTVGLAMTLTGHLQSELPSDALWRIAIQAITVMALARLLRALVQTTLLRLFSGQSLEALEAQVITTGLRLDSSSLARIESRTVWEGLAVLSGFMAMSWSVFFFPAEFRVLAGLFTAWAVLIELSPFVHSPGTELIRYMFSLTKGNEDRTVGWLSVVTTAWIFSAGYVTIKGTLILLPIARESLRADLNLVGLAVLTWISLATMIAWLEDCLDGAVDTFETDHRRLRRRFRLPLRRVLERVRHTAGEFADPKTWLDLPLIRQMDVEVRQTVLVGAKVKTYRRGRAICRQDESKRTLFIMLSGQAAVVKRPRGKRAFPVAILEDNSVFGEAGYFMATPRTADVIALENSVVLALEPQRGSGKIDAQRFHQLQMRIWFLQAMQRNPMFREIPQEAIDFLLLQGRTVQIQAGSQVVREGDWANSCYFVIQGQAKILQKNAVINQVAEGSVIGEIALFQEDSRRTATVVANSDLLAIEIDRDRFWEILTRHFAFGLAIERLADLRLNQDRQRLERLRA